MGLLLDIERDVAAGKLTESFLRAVQVGLHAHQALLNELSFPACGRSVRKGEHAIQLIEIGLRDCLSSPGIGIAECNRDDAALLVVNHRRMAGKILDRIDAITLLVNVLQVEAVNYVVSDGAAVQQIDEQSSRGSPTPQQAGETTESRQSTRRMAGECREHSCARRR